jgi:thioredoxin-dependent peroxiredoxin
MVRFMRVLVLALTLALSTSAGAAMLRAGDRFPAWQLVDQTGAAVSSKDLAGRRYLLWFYPKAMTPGCTAEGEGLRDAYASFQAKGVAVYGVSFDTPVDNARFVAAEAFPFKLLSDEKRTLAVQVGAADSVDAPVARRISYLVGPDGVVLAAYDGVQPSTHAKQVLDDLH